MQAYVCDAMQNIIDKEKINMNVSVLMPVFNGELYLAEAIESILIQTHNQFEFIIIDDFSTDKSVEIIKRYQAKDDRIQLLTNEFAKGIVGSLNTGLKHASGVYIARADADDINVSTRFEDQISFLKNHPDVSIVGAGYFTFNELGPRRKIFHPACSLLLAWKYVSDSFFCHPVTMFKKDVALDCGGYAQTEAEDFDLFSKMLKKHKGRNLNKILVRYREHQASRSRAHVNAIMLSVREIFLKNYSYYLGNQNDAEKFFRFQSHKLLSAKDFFNVASVNKKIIQKIVQDYKMSFFSFETIGLVLIVSVFMIKAVIKSSIMPLKDRMRPYYRLVFRK